MPLDNFLSFPQLVDSFSLFSSLLFGFGFISFCFVWCRVFRLNYFDVFASLRLLYITYHIHIFFSFSECVHVFAVRSHVLFFVFPSFFSLAFNEIHTILSIQSKKLLAIISSGKVFFLPSVSIVAFFIFVIHPLPILEFFRSYWKIFVQRVFGPVFFFLFHFILF